MIQSVPVEIEKLDSYGDLPLPCYQTEGAAGFDFLAANTDDVIIEPGKWVMIPTGLKFAVPQGCELQVRPRSGLAAKNGVTVLNTPGTIDSDYRGEVKIILINLSDKAFVVERGMRIAQGIVAPYYKADFALCDSLDATERGEGGFGHTGV
ncbi:MAG: dUTP diphosphatase [Firmicutes bacterium]|nr:dUTP diphosphatase [Bacillota bacterium]